MKSLEELLALLDNVVTEKNGTAKARCPGHNDGTHKGEQSLSITLEGDKILLHCFAGCDNAKIMQGLGLKISDLFINKPEKPGRRPERGEKGVVEKIYPYQDLSGHVIFEVVRYKPKSFRQRRPDGHGNYIWDLKGIEPVLYRLPMVTAAIADGRTILHVEGEKDADNLVQLGFDATTSPKGAKSWKKSYAIFYTGAARVILFPDKDEPGRAYSHGVAADLFHIVGEVKVIELPGEHVKDASDWIAAGGTKEQLEKLISEAPAWRPPEIEESMNYDSINQTLKSLSDDQYCVLNGAFHRIVHTREGDIYEQPICNFVAKIKEDILKDNGADSNRFLKIQGRINGSLLPTVMVPEADFDAMKWVRKEWGVKTRIIAGRSANDHMINAISYSSDKVKERRVYTHTGWREINGKMVFLTSGGAIGDPEAEVELPSRLSRYNLPKPEGDPKIAIQKSLELLDIADLNVTIPTLILPYLSVLNVFEEISFTPWYLGRSGALKSVVTALAVSHFGNFTHKTLPVNWFGTRTELEKLSFLAKDVLFPIDDYAPPSDANSARDINRTVEYMIRDVGNRQGRVRSNSDMTSQTTYFPRCLSVTSGEQLPPPGVSRSARILPIPVKIEDFYTDGELNYHLLTRSCQ
jgi:Domain of unknown function (DUF927)